MSIRYSNDYCYLTISGINKHKSNRLVECVVQEGQGLNLEVCYSISQVKTHIIFFQTGMSKQPKEPEKKKSRSRKDKSNPLQSRLITNSTQSRNTQAYSHKITPDKQPHLSRSFEQSPQTQIKLLIDLCTVDPKQSFKKLLQLYEVHLSMFLKFSSQDQGFNRDTIRPIFLLAKYIILYHEHFPFLDIQKTIKVFEDLLKVVIQSPDSVTQPELYCLEQTNSIFWKLNQSLKQMSLIRKNALICLLKLSVQLGKPGRSIRQRQSSVQLVNKNIREMVEALQNGSSGQIVWMGESFNEFIRQSLDNIAMVAEFSRCNLPIFDFMALSIASPNSEIYQLVVNYLFGFLKSRLQQRLEQNSDESRPSEQGETTIELLFAVFNAFNIKSIFAEASQTTSTNLYYSRQIIFLVLMVYRSHFAKLLEELEKIDRNSIQRQTIRSIFQVATVGNVMNNTHAIKEIISNIFLSPELKRHLIQDPNLATTSAEQSNTLESMQVIVRSCEKSLFDLLYKMEKLLSLYNLDCFLDLYVENPTTFRSDYFIENLFQNQAADNILTFMKEFTKRWILVEAKKFDFNFYLLHFLKKCVMKDTIGLIGHYVKSLAVQQLLKVNSIIYKLSFEEDKKKIAIPELINESFQLASITSAGYADRYLLINKVFLDFSQQLVWKEVINSIQSSGNYIYVKAFYNVVNHEFSFQNSLPQILEAVQQLNTAINKQKIEDMYAIFHWLACIFTYTENLTSLQQINKEICQQKTFQIIIDRAEQLMGLCEMVCERRRAAMNHVVLSSEMMNENIRYFEKVKRMHLFFLRSVIQWMQKLRNIDKMVKHKKPYEQVIEICCKLSKDVEFCEYHLMRTLSNLCSEKYFSNLLETKIYNKILNKQHVSTTYIILLRQVIFNMMQRYNSEDHPNHYCFSETDILSYFLFVLASKLTITNERELLKQKLIILDLFVELTRFFLERPSHQLREYFQQKYTSYFKDLVIEIAVQNPQLVSKYQRQLIVHLRVTAITHILQYFETPCQILDKDDLFSFAFQLCFDKLLEIRLLMFNIMTSRFKSKQFRCFLNYKNYIMTYLTIFAVFQPSPVLNATAKKTIQAVKKAGDEICSLGLVVLLYSIKLILNHVFNCLLKEEYHFNLDYFLKSFDALWLSKKEWEYATYFFCQKYIEERRFSFITCQLSYKSWIQPYITSRQKSDFILESEIKQYLRNDFEFSFQLPIDDPPLDFRMKFIQHVMDALPFRIFHKLKSIVIGKTRPSRVLKGRKDIKIDWLQLQQQRLLRFHNEPLDREKVKLSII